VRGLRCRGSGVFKVSLGNEVMKHTRDNNERENKHEGEEEVIRVGKEKSTKSGENEQRENCYEKLR